MSYQEYNHISDTVSILTELARGNRIHPPNSKKSRLRSETIVYIITEANEIITEANETHFTIPDIAKTATGNPRPSTIHRIRRS